MIKDKIIQKKIKGKVLAVAMTAVMASLFVPVRVDAADEIPECELVISEGDINGGTGSAVLKSTDTCSATGKCKGHIVKGDMNDAAGIDVQSGHHYIKLQGTNITSPSGSAIKVQDGATLTLVVEGSDNSLTGGTDAGIYVSQKADLVITSVDGNDDANILKVRSTGLGAGIGGYSIDGDSAKNGGITIESGTIVAQGGSRGAGIGGSGYGSTGTGKSITINGGTVIAKGGDGVPDADNKSGKRFGASGIGCGNQGGKSGNIVINGGNVTAIGGMNADKNPPHAAGIRGGTLTSVNGGGQTVVISDDIEVTADSLSGLVWDLYRKDGELVDKNDDKIKDDDFITNVLTADKGIAHGNICTVHNQAVMPPDFPKDFNTHHNNVQNILRIPTGTSLRIPAELDFTTSGIIDAEANSTLINPDNLHFTTDNSTGLQGDWYGSALMNYRVSFNAKRDVSLKEPFTYKGEAYKGEALPSNEIFEVATNIMVDIASQGVKSCPIDRTGLKHIFKRTDNVSTDPDKGDEVKDAGDYVLKLTYGGTTTDMSFKVDPLDINSNEIEISRIPDKEYKGAPFDVNDFSDVTVIYKGNPVATGDFAVKCDPLYEKVGDASVTIVGDQNFMGERKVSFKITPIVLTEENTTVTLSGGNSIKYNGQPHKPSVSSIEVRPSTGAPLKMDSWNAVYECSAGENNWTDAGDINIRITPKSDNFQGEVSAKFVIEPRELQVISITPTRTERPYDGTALIKISEVEIDLSANGPNGDQNSNDGILSQDRGEGLIEGLIDGTTDLPVSLTGILCDNNGTKLEKANVSETGYTNVFLDTDMRLAGTKGRNYTLTGHYTIDGTDGHNKLTSPIIITKRDAPVVDVTGEPVPDEMNEPKFICNLIVKGRDPEKDVIDPESPIYYYRSTGEGEEPPAKDDLDSWQTGTLESLTVGNLAPNSEETFYVMVGATPNVAGAEPQVCSVVIPKYPRKAGPLAEECRLAASETPNEDGETYKLTVEPAQIISEIYPDGRYLYSLSEEGPYIGGDPSSLFNNVEPKTEYTAYVKYAATDEYTESETGTPTNSVTTNEGKAQKPTVTCNGTTQSEGEIHFSGTASVSLEYTGGLQDYEIRFTKDGTQPTASSELYGAPFEVSESITVNAFVIKPGVASSEVTSVKLVRDGDSPSNPSTGTEVELQKLTEETAPALLGATALPTKGIDTFDAVSTPLATPILQQRGYENNNITYADLKIKIKGTDRYATEDDFKNAAGGVIRVTITMDQLKAIGLPAGYDGTTHNFAVTHMFATAGANLGNVETIGTAHNFSKSRDGKSISFDMTSTSPVAFGWADVNNSDPNPVGPGTDDPGNQDPGTDDPGNQDPGTQDPGTQDPNTIVGEGDPRQGAQGTQGNGTTTGTDAGTQGASNDAANALSGIMPKTGDPLSFVPWIAAIVISVGAIAFFATRKRDKKKQTVKKTQAAKKKK